MSSMRWIREMLINAGKTTFELERDPDAGENYWSVHVIINGETIWSAGGPNTTPAQAMDRVLEAFRETPMDRLLQFSDDDLASIALALKASGKLPTISEATTDPK